MLDCYVTYSIASNLDKYSEKLTEDILEKFIQWCHKGPITARVDQVVFIPLDSDEVFSSFEIR